jgi:EmrB/QacA subfamily drug resistance transporter
VPDQSIGAPLPAAADSVAIDPALRRLAGTVILGAIMVILDTTIVAVAIDTLGRDFHTSLSTISWVTTGYLLALAVVIPLTGWAVERFGATRMWNISLVLFLVGSALCGTAWSAGSLIFFRILQGIGGGMIMPICMTLLARAAGPQRMGRMMSVVGIPALVAPVLGPVIGGLLIDNLNWRWIFLVNLPIGAVALFASWRVLPRDDRGASQHKLDVPGVLLISPGLAALVYGLSEAGNGGGFGSAKVETCLVAGVLLLTGFVVHALRHEGALLDMRLFSNRVFSFASLASFVIGAVLFGALFLFPLYYQTVRGQSALSAGLLMAPQGLGAMLVMPLAGRITDRRGAGHVVPIGMVIILLSTAIFTQVDAHTNEVALSLALFVRGIGFGATMMPAMGAAYQTLDPSAVPRATTTLNILQRVGGSIATALVAVVLQQGIRHRVPGAAGAGGLGSTQGRRLPDSVATALGHAFGATFWWVVGLSAVGLAASLFLPRTVAVAAGGPVQKPKLSPVEAVLEEAAIEQMGTDGTALDEASSPTPEPVR